MINLISIIWLYCLYGDIYRPEMHFGVMLGQKKVVSHKSINELTRGGKGSKSKEFS
jgi:hypothetical protein